MYKEKRLVKNLLRLILPAILVVALGVIGGAVWLVKETSHVKAAPYLIKPDKYGQLSSRAAQITEATWSNADGSQSRGWLLRGSASAPAIILFHKYGADRSYVLNLGVKLSEASNFTVLMPDLRGHGENPLVRETSFGGSEAKDVAGAIAFLKGLKTPDQTQLVGNDIGLYGVELGAVTAISAASSDPNVKALVLDDVPQDSDAVLAAAIAKRFPFAASYTSQIASLGTGLYFYDGNYTNGSTCEEAKTLMQRKILLLSGTDAADFRDSTSKLTKCFTPGAQVEAKFDLSPSGYSIMNASIEQAEAYDQRVIDFFKQSFPEAQTLPPPQPQVQDEPAADPQLQAKTTK